MTKFEDELHNNNFVSSYCVKCEHWVWPPSEFCNKCLGTTTWKQVSKNAKLVEVSRKDGKYFCIAEFEGNIRVIGTILETSNPIPGQTLVIHSCSYDKNPKFVFKIA